METYPQSHETNSVCRKNKQKQTYQKKIITERGWGKCGKKDHSHKTRREERERERDERERRERERDCCYNYVSCNVFDGVVAS